MSIYRIISNIGAAKNNSKARGRLVLEWKQWAPTLGGGALIWNVHGMFDMHYDVHFLLRRVLTWNPLGFLTDIVAEA